MKIINILARYPGSSHDAVSWHSRRAHGFLEHLHENGERSTWLLGDSGYPLQPWLITPFLSPSVERHSRVRSLVERCIGLLKIRFRCILGENKLRYRPQTVGAIINSCAVLHNILIENNFPITPEEEEEIGRTDFLVDISEGESVDTTTRGVAVDIRNRIMQEILNL